MSFANVFTVTKQLISGNELNKALAYILRAFASGLTGTAAGTMANSIAITESYTEFDTVASGGAGAVLPYPTPGQSFVVYNGGLNTLTVFSANAKNAAATGSNIINAAGSSVAGSTGISLSTVRTATFVCMKTGLWVTVLGAAS
jgi:hypothetical protein